MVNTMTGIVERYQNVHTQISRFTANVGKMFFSFIQITVKIVLTDKEILKVVISNSKKRHVMKPYKELRIEIETIQPQMVEAKKNERTDALKKFNRLCKEFGFITDMLKDTLAEGRKKT